MTTLSTQRVMSVVLTAALAAVSAFAQSKPRARDLGIPFDGTPGPLNAITDVAGVEVGYTTLISGEGKLTIGQGPVRTGVTAILPRGRGTFEPTFAAFHSGNGNGDMTGTHWIEESGVLETPILITNSLSVGVVRDAAVNWMVRQNAPGPFWYPVVAETADVPLNDIKGQHVKSEHVFSALDSARGGRIGEGNVGGGTGMNCHGFKGGTGTASRRIPQGQGGYTVGVLVQCNYGSRSQLRIAGIPVGREIQGYDPCVTQQITPGSGQLCGQPGEFVEKDELGSIIVVVATDAPLTPDQLQRIVKRVTLGMGRMGSTHGNGSGDIFIAFSTANRGVDRGNSGGVSPLAPTVTRLPSGMLNPLFSATIEATEEAIVNGMVAAETMVGADYWRSSAIPHEPLRQILRKYGRLVQ